jgi:hypothetical protein
MLERARSVMAQQLRLGDVILRRRTPNSSRRFGSELPRREARRGTSASTSPPNIRQPNAFTPLGLRNHTSQWTTPLGNAERLHLLYSRRPVRYENPHGDHHSHHQPKLVLRATTLIYCQLAHHPAKILAQEGSRPWGFPLMELVPHQRMSKSQANVHHAHSVLYDVLR